LLHQQGKSAQPNPWNSTNSHTHGWRYDPGSLLFMHGEKVLDWKDVLSSLPGLSEDDIVAHQDAKWDNLSPADRRNAQAD
jgi:hypothetical protein